jgi:CIC family chloride channel protein
MSFGTPANLATLEREINEGTAKQVGELVDGINSPHAHPDQGVDLALERMGANQIDVLPIVNARMCTNWKALLPCAMS